MTLDTTRRTVAAGRHRLSPGPAGVIAAGGYRKVPYDRPGFVHVTHGRHRHGRGRPRLVGRVAGSGLFRGARARGRQRPAGGDDPGRASQPEAAGIPATCLRPRPACRAGTARAGRSPAPGGADERWVPGSQPARLRCCAREARRRPRRRRPLRGLAPGSLLTLSIAGCDKWTGLPPALRRPGAGVPCGRRVREAAG